MAHQLKFMQKDIDMTEYFYSPSTNGFYTTDVHLTMPSDVVAIESYRRYQYLLVGINSGKIIQNNGGVLDLANPPPPPVDVLWAAIRLKRDQLLSMSDWTQLQNGPETLDVSAWATYRKALRDLPQLYATPELVIWPTPPS